MALRQRIRNDGNQALLCVHLFVCLFVIKITETSVRTFTTFGMLDENGTEYIYVVLKTVCIFNNLCTFICSAFAMTWQQ